MCFSIFCALESLGFDERGWIFCLCDWSDAAQFSLVWDNDGEKSVRVNGQLSKVGDTSDVLFGNWDLSLLPHQMVRGEDLS